MSLELIRGELERLYSLDELLALSRELLGFDPANVGGNASVASFARALTEHCRSRDAVAALIDAVSFTQAQASPKLQGLSEQLLRAPVDLKPGSDINEFKIVRKLGVGPNGTSYVAKRDDETRILKLLHASASHDKSGVYRFIMRARLLAGKNHDNLPTGLEAGFIDDIPYISYRYIEAKPLAPRVTRTGALHINEARAIIEGIIDALAAIHHAKLVHGALKLENVLVGKAKKDAPMAVLLVDAGGDLLSSSWIHSDVAHAGGDRIKGLAPEQIRGLGCTSASDIYALGALLFEVLTGKPALQETSATDLAVAHLSKKPRAAKDVAPKGWVSDDVSTLIAQMLEKDPKKRPDLATVSKLLGAGKKVKDKVTDDEVNDSVDLLVADPSDGEAAIALELMIERGADAKQVADAFLMAADMVDLDEAAETARANEKSAAIAEVKAEAARDRARDTQKGLFRRAARLFDSHVEDAAMAEDAYKSLLALAPNDEDAQTGYAKALQAQDKLHDLVEHLLEMSEATEDNTERASALHRIGRLYAGPLDDNEQAMVAFTSALAAAPERDDYADDLEKAAGEDMEQWAEAMRELHAACEQPDMPEEDHDNLLMRLGNWYADKIGRADLALPCFEAVLNKDPGNTTALKGMGNVYRRAQQWGELVQVLLSRAERAPTPERARDLRAEAASILDGRMDDVAGARELYENTLKEDPGHEKTIDALARIYKRNDDWDGYVKILQTQASALTGTARAEALCKIAEIHEDQLNDLAEAERRYNEALEINNESMTAIRGLDRIFSRAGRYKDLLENIDRQMMLAATPRKKINLLTRVAGIHDEEFLDHEKASAAYENILQIDSAHEASLGALMRHYRALDRWDDVIELYDRSLRVSTDDDRRVQLLLAQGRVLMDFGSPERARNAYEHVLQLDPSNASALESLSHVRAATGDAMAALSAIESLAENAKTSQQEAELWLRAAKILEEQGDATGAIQRYKQALDAEPDNRIAGKALRDAYLAKGDAASAVELVTQEISRTDGKLSKARLYAEMATLQRNKLNQNDAARLSARKAADLDPTNVGALLILGDIAFETDNFNEAVTHYGGLASRAEAMAKDDATRMLMRYIDALARSGSTKKAKGGVESLLKLAGDDPQAVRRAAQVMLDADEPGRASELFAQVVGELGGSLEKEERAKVLVNYGKALRLAGKLEEAQAPLTEASDLVPSSLAPIEELAKLHEARGDWEEVVRIKQQRCEVADGDERGQLLLEIGELLANKVKDPTRAAKTFVAALEERPDDRRVLTRLMQLYSTEKDWGKLIDVVLKLGDGVDDKKQKAKYIHTAAGVAARQMGDLDIALGYLDQVEKLDPSNEKVLEEQIEYRELQGDWDKLMVHLRRHLERLDKQQDKAGADKILDRIGRLHEQQGDWEGLMSHLEARIERLDKQQDDEGADKVLDRIGQIYQQQGNWEGLMGHLKVRIKRLEKRGDKDGVVVMLDRIAQLYEEKQSDPDKAVTVYEQAQQLDPENMERLDTLSRLYHANPDVYLDKAIGAQMLVLERDPTNAAPYRALRKLYTGAKQADPAWCVCQALYVIGLAAPDEERFFRRMRADGPAEATDRLAADDWKRLHHPALDPIVTKIFQLIEPAIMTRNAQPLVALGYQEAYKLDLSMHPYPMSQTLNYAAGVLGMDVPMTFQNPNDPGGLTFLHAHPPCIVLGANALATELPPQPTSFVAAQHLTYYRSGLYVRHLVPTGTGLRGWLFAAIKLIHDQFPVSSDLESMVNENLDHLRAFIQGPIRDQLASAVSKLLQSGAIDLKRWVAGVDLTADRAGFLLCNDLEVATAMVKASDESTSSLSQQDRLRALTLFSVDASYLSLRLSLGINIDA